MSAEECANTLTAWILTENKIVTYKLLSRLLRIKVNLAKQFMAEWHTDNPNVHATYVLCGTNFTNSSSERQVPSQVSSENQLRTSEVVRSTPQTTRSRVIRLVSQDELEKVRSGFQEVTSCHVYSLEPSRLKDISIVSSIAHDVKTAMIGQSTRIMDLANTYGLIFNPAVHELDQNPKKRKLPEYQIKPIIKAEPVKKPPVIERETSNTSTSSKTARSEKTIDKNVPALKRNASSSLASAFAKTQKPKVKSESEPATVIAQARQEVPSQQVPPKTNIAPLKNQGSISETKEQRTKREEENKALKEMMMKDDDLEAVESPSNVVVDEVMLDADDWSASDTEMTETKPAMVDPVRKRSKKRVKKQVHTTDAKGYMVTTEEWEWISCDEEEAPDPPAPIRQNSTKSSLPPAKTKVAPKKKVTGQAGIASFFAKKG